MTSSQSNNDLTTIRVLAVDDDMAALETYKSLLNSSLSEEITISELEQLNTPFEGERDNNRHNHSHFDITLDTTTDGATAVELVQRSLQNGTPYHTALIDYRMPLGLNGLETAQEIRKTDPDLNIIFVSAYMGEPLETLRQEFRGKFSLLRKPFDHQELYQQVLLMSYTWRQQKQLSGLLSAEPQPSVELEQSFHVMESECKFSVSLAHNMKDGIYVLDAEGKLTFLNKAAERMLGWRYADVMGQNFHALIHPHDPDQPNHVPIEHCPLHVSSSKQETYSDTIWLHCSTGHRIPVEITVSPLISHRGKMSGSVAVFHDISTRIELDESLRHAVDKAREESIKVKKAIQAQEDFVASMSHELRTPLTAIIGCCDDLREQLTTAEQEENLNCILAASESQLSLINDILDMSKIESGKFSIDEGNYSVQALLKEIELMLSLRVEGKGLKLKVEQHSESYMLCGDQQRVKQILINLIGNAIKFTEQGSITLSTSVDGDKLYFAVEDTGIGIHPDNFDKLFQRFEQEDSSINGRFGGSGLGLYISKSLANLMDGDLHVSSELGKGSRFTLALPYKPTQKRDATIDLNIPEREVDETPSFYGTVLLVEDTEILQFMIRRMLEKLGVTVVLAEDGQEAVDWIEQEQFDLILMDMQMPVMDGVEATRQIRAKGITTPLYGLTANVMKRHRKAFAEAGSDGLIAKPIDKKELIQVLNQALKS